MERKKWVAALVIVFVVGLVGAYAAGIIFPRHQSNNIVKHSDTDNGSSNVTQTSTDDTTATDDSAGQQTNDTTPEQTVDVATIAGYANVVEFDELAIRNWPDGPVASTINATVTVEYAPGTVYGNGGLWMHNDTWYPLMVNETVVGTAYSGEVWDVVCLGNSTDAANLTIQQKIDWAWATVDKTVVNNYAYCVLGHWNTSDKSHTISLRYSYTGPDLEYRANLVTVSANGSVVGCQLMNPVVKNWGLFNPNFIG